MPQEIFMKFLPRNAPLCHRVDLLSDKADYHATPAPDLYFVENPRGRHTCYEHGCSESAVTSGLTSCRQREGQSSACGLPACIFCDPSQAQARRKGTPRDTRQVSGTLPSPSVLSCVTHPLVYTLPGLKTPSAKASYPYFLSYGFIPTFW